MITASKRHLKAVIISLAFGLCACGLVDGIKHKAFDWLISKEEIVFILLIDEESVLLAFELDVIKLQEHKISRNNCNSKMILFIL